MNTEELARHLPDDPSPTPARSAALLNFIVVELRPQASRKRPKQTEKAMVAIDLSQGGGLV
jgi:hypothetical protein